MATGGSPGLSLKSTPSKGANNYSIISAQERTDKQNQIKAQEARDTASKLAIEVIIITLVVVCCLMLLLFSFFM